MEVNKIYNINFLDNTLPDKCANLIIADPPYFEVKGDFDFVWDSFEHYLQDVEKWCLECKRLLADNGTLFWYGHAKKLAYSQVILDEYFELENNISIEFNRQTKKGVEQFRCFAPVTERLLMYTCGNRFGEWIKKKRIEKNLSTITVAELGKFYGKVNHGGSVSNWENGGSVPSEEQYSRLSEILDLKLHYNEAIRYFNNAMKLYDAMKFDQEAHITGKYDHDTCKPETLTRALILTCSRPNDLVVVPFAGSGTECAMSVKEGRKTIGFEITEKHAKMSNDRVQNILCQPSLFFGS